MKEFLQTLIEWGPAGLMLAALLDGAGLPIPGGVDAFVVFLASHTPGSAWWFASLAVLGSTCGNFILFLLARRGGQKWLDRAKGTRSERFRQWFDQYGLLTVFISALVPLPVMPMKIFVLCAGALGSRTELFLLSFVAARAVRYFGLAYLGQSMGDNALDYLRAHLWQLSAIAAALFIALLLLVRFADRRLIAKA